MINLHNSTDRILCDNVARQTHLGSWKIIHKNSKTYNAPLQSWKDHQNHFFTKHFIRISGSESFTRWLAPGSKLGASWSEGSETNVILGFRVPTTIGLRKPPAGSPCSQSIPGSLEPLGGQGAMGKVGAS